MSTPNNTAVVLESPQVLEVQRRRRSWSWVTKATLPVIILVGWAALAKSSLVPPLTMPTPWGTVLELKVMWEKQDLAMNIGAVSYTHLTLPTNREV